LNQNLEKLALKRAESEAECDKLRVQIDGLKGNLAADSKERMNLEREISKLMDMEDGDRLDSQRQIELRKVYNDLSDLSQLRLQSKEFHCRLQVFISNHPLKVPE
jgi:hypothetical protein